MIETVKYIVDSDTKERFSIKVNCDGKLSIRANQGHSFPGIVLDELCGQRILSLKNGEICCHGTKYQCLKGILKGGLLAGGLKGLSFRRAIHMATSLPGKQERSGIRSK